MKVVGSSPLLLKTGSCCFGTCLFRLCTMACVGTPNALCSLVSRRQSPLIFLPLRNRRRTNSPSYAFCPPSLLFCQESRGHTGSLCCLSWSPDDLHLLTCGTHSSLRLWGIRALCSHNFCKRTSSLVTIITRRPPSAPGVTRTHRLALLPILVPRRQSSAVLWHRFHREAVGYQEHLLQDFR